MTVGVRIAAARAVLAIAFAIGAIAQPTSQTPAQITHPGEVASRPATGDASDGTARIDGHVTGADGSPLLNARVVLTDTLTGQTRSEVSDEDGHYLFDKLPAGTYEASASKMGYVSVDFGAPRAHEPGRRLAVGDDESVGRVDFTLPRVGAIVGRVADENGDPVQGAVATAYATRFANGRRALVVQGTSRPTDDLGRFRIYGLQPGGYVIAAAAAATGVYRLPGYARAFYPGSPSLGDAQPVELSTGDDAAGVEVRLTPGRSATVSGSAETPDGRPFTERVTVALTRRSSALEDAAVPARPSPDGTFTIQNLSPGEYVLKASRLTPGGLQFAEQFLNVDGDLRGVALHLAGGSRVSGRIAFEGDASRASPRDVAFMFQSVDTDQSPEPGSFRARINDDWTFEYSGLFGPMLIRPTARGDWLLKSIRANGVDVTDTPIAFGRGEQSLGDVEVIFTSRGARLSASVADGRGRPAPVCSAIVFSTDRRRWDRFTRFVKTTRCDPDGTITVRGLPGGDYYVVTTDRTIGSDEGGGWQDPAYLESLIPAASRVTLTEGQTTSATLRIATAR